MKSYCTLCGNVEFEVSKDNPNHHCPVCKAIIEGPMQKAWEKFEEGDDAYGTCCFSLNRDKDILDWHSDAFTCSYPPDAKDDDVLQVAVETQVYFHPEYAETSWTFDNDSYVCGIVFGERIHYSDPNFWKKLEEQMSRAAEEAWDSDVLSCLHCGYHYNASVEPCGCTDYE